MATYPNFKTIEEVKAHVESKGKYFFSPDTMRFFNSKVESPVYGGIYFVTSDRQNREVPKMYTVRKLEENGSVETIGKFQQYSSLSDARDEAKRLGQVAKAAQKQPTAN